MNMELLVTQTNIAGVTMELAEYIKENHPNMILREGREAVEKFCLDRTDKIVESFCLHMAQGISEIGAWELAHKELYAGLIFSRYNVVKDLLQTLNRFEYEKRHNNGILIQTVSDIVEKAEIIFEAFQVTDETFVSNEMEQRLAPIILKHLAE